MSAPLKTEWLKVSTLEFADGSTQSTAGGGGGEGASTSMDVSKASYPSDASIAPGDDYTVVWENEDLDTMSGFNLPSNGTIFTAPADGNYEVDVNINLGVNVGEAQAAKLFLRRSGAFLGFIDVQRIERPTIDSPAYGKLKARLVVPMTTGQTILVGISNQWETEANLQIAGAESGQYFTVKKLAGPTGSGGGGGEVSTLWTEDPVAQEFIYNLGYTIGVNTDAPDTNYIMHVVGGFNALLLEGNSYANPLVLRSSSNNGSSSIVWQNNSGVDKVFLTLNNPGTAFGTPNYFVTYLDGITWSLETNFGPVASVAADTGVFKLHGTLEFPDGTTMTTAGGGGGGGGSPEDVLATPDTLVLRDGNGAIAAAGITSSEGITAVGAIQSDDSMYAPQIGSDQFSGTLAEINEVVASDRLKGTFNDFSGGPGDVLWNYPMGKVSVASGQNKVVVYNDWAAANSVAIANIAAAGTGAQIESVVMGAQQFTINLTANATMDVPIHYIIMHAW